MDEERSCFNCNKFAVCWMRLQIDADLTKGLMQIMDLNSDEAPENYARIFLALGNACLIFEGK